ncbi:MAG: hypothetical protein RMK29_08805 [Myxococcales bacterium]|nr:hypothetical protein [Myxococcota bacterium]MDW8281796.1 hypothetical protein [Myxococcales bacterium]
MRRPHRFALCFRHRLWLKDQRGFTGAEKALLVCVALALIALVAALVSRGSQEAGGDARRTLASQGGTVAALGEVVRPVQAAGAPGTPGGGGGAGSSTQPGGGGSESSRWSVGGSGSGQGWSYIKQTQGERVLGGAPAQTSADKEKEAQGKRGGQLDAEIGVEYKLFDKQGALAERSFAGGSEQVSAGYGKVAATAFGKASLQEGAAVGVNAEGKISAINWQGKHEIFGIQQSHEVDVLSVKGSLTGRAGISKDVVGATVVGEVGANLVEAKLEGSRELFKIPFTNIGVELGGGVSGAVGANAAGEASAGYFKGEDNKRRFGVKIGGKAALGLGLGGKLSLNLVW